MSDFDLLPTKEDKRWMKRLQKCLKEIPEGRCLRVQSLVKNMSTLGLMSEELSDEIDNLDADRMGLGISEYFVDEFQADHVIADSECI